MPSAPRAAASARPTKTRWRGARCACRTCSSARNSPPSWARSSTSTTSCCSTISSSRPWTSRRRWTSSSRTPSACGRWSAMSRRRCAALREQAADVMFEGAQGAMLDVDHGTYPFVTSSNTTGGFAGHRNRARSARSFDYVLGIVKAYTTRVGAGPFPTELFDEYGEHLSRVGHEFGAVTGRKRRCGWFDAVSLRRSIIHSSVSGLCLTKLDVLDGLDTLQICVGYKSDGEVTQAAAVVRRRLRGRRAGLRGNAGLEGIHHRRHLVPGACRRMRRTTCSVCRSWRAFRSTSFRPGRIATRPSCCAIRSIEGGCRRIPTAMTWPSACGKILPPNYRNLSGRRAPRFIYSRG